MPLKNSNDWTKDKEYVDLMIFLIDRTRDAKSPLSINHLASEFIEKNGSAQSISCLTYRIRTLREKAVGTDIIDAITKVKITFALSAPIDTRYLEELRKDAYVEIDENHRIKKYIAKNGRLHLEGDHTMSAKMRDVLRPKMEVDSEYSMLTTPESMKRAAPGVPNFSKRTRTGGVKSEDFAPDPDDSDRIDAPNPWIQQLRQLKSDLEGISDFRAREPNPEIPLLREPKLEEEDPGISGAQKAPIDAPGVHIFQSEAYGTQIGGASAQEDPILRIGSALRASEAPEAEMSGKIPIKTEPDAYTPQIQLLETMKFLISLLDIPSLSPLQAKIEQKMRESSSDTMIPNNTMILAMEVLVMKIINYSVPIFTESSAKSVTLKEFLCYLKAAILNSKLEGLEGLLEKIREIIQKLASKDKDIPVEKVASALQAALDVIGI